MHKILTGKTKDDFEKWYIKKDVSEDEFYNIWEEWSSLSTSCKNAFYIDFFDSIGIYIEISFYDDSYWTYNIYSNKPVLEKETANICNNRQEATEEAIKKANEIYNSK